MLRCDYDTTGNTEVVTVISCSVYPTDSSYCVLLVVQGGESTNEEMCLSFPVFYPRAADGSSMVTCRSFLGESSFNDFAAYLST